jgi:hypothetical protein
VSSLRTLSALVLVAALAACAANRHTDQASAGSQTQSEQNGAGVMTGSPAPPVSNTTPVGAQAAGNGGSMVGVAAPLPSTINCGSDQPVWVNQRTHVYHEPADPLYGRTKHGAYMCPSAAVAAGYHPAGKHRHHWSGSPAPASTGPSQ